MALLNYTTSISIDKTIAEIQKILRQAGAKRIMVEYTDEQDIQGVAFQIEFKGQLVSYLLPANVDAVHDILQCESRKYRTYEQAERVAWRIVKDWIKAQLALVAAEQGHLAQVFLPYAQDPNTGQTIWQKLEGDGGMGLLEFKP